MQNISRSVVLQFVDNPLVDRHRVSDRTQQVFQEGIDHVDDVEEAESCVSNMKQVIGRTSHKHDGVMNSWYNPGGGWQIS